MKKLSNYEMNVMKDNESILSLCCKYKSTTLLEYIVNEYKKGSPNLLKKQLMQPQDKDANTLAFICAKRKNNNTGQKQQQQQQRKQNQQLKENECLVIILENMKEMLNKSQFLNTINHKNSKKVDLLTLLNRSNDEKGIKKVQEYIKMMKCMFFVFCLVIFFFFSFSFSLDFLLIF